MKPKFSVIIPTYNRGPYLRHTLESCRRQTYKYVEFIVRDDASEDETSIVASEFVASDPRFRYVRANENAGMLENFERALDEADGDYVLCLGGDDGLLAEALASLSTIVLRYPKKLVTWPTGAYIYAGSRDNESQLVLPHAAVGGCRESEISSTSFFERQVSKLFYVSDPQAPMLYVKSAVPRRLLDDAKRISGGRFFACSTPDGYSAFALAALSKTYVYINKPHSIHGVAPNSAGLNYVQGQNDEKDLSKRFFQRSDSMPMSRELGSLPYSPLISLMTADFLFKSDEVFNHGFSKRINMERLIEFSLNELCDGLMAKNKVIREIDILSRLSDYLGLRKFFIKKVSEKYRNARRTLTGDAISPRLVYLRSDRLAINNVTAAVEYIAGDLNGSRPYRDLSWSQAIYNSGRYFFQGRRRLERLYDLIS
jgi:glycosyltransferase involved in cell wall biosynthesis